MKGSLGARCPGIDHGDRDAGGSVPMVYSNSWKAINILPLMLIQLNPDLIELLVIKLDGM